MDSRAWILVAIIFFAVSAMAHLLYALVFKKSSLLDPIVQFYGLFSLFVLPLPIRAFMTNAVEEDVTEHLSTLVPYLPWALFLSALGLPFFTYAYYSASARRIGMRLPTPSIGRSSRLAFLLISILSFGLLVALTNSAGGVIDLVLMGYNSSAEIFGRGYLAVGFPWLGVGVMFLLCRYAQKRKWLDLLAFFAALTIVAAMNLIMGNRSQLMFLGIAIIIFWHNAIRALKFRHLVAIGILGFLLLNLVGRLRGSNYESISDFWTKTTEPNKPALEDSHSFLYTLTTGEFVVPFETLPQMIASVGQDVSPQLGLTYLKAPLFFIPSVIFPSRPDALTHWYMLKFYGDTYGLNEGRAFFFLSEGYLNFGPVGIILTMFCWGLALGTAENYRRQANNATGALLLYSLSIAYIFRGIAGDFVSVFVGLPEQSLSIALLGIWISRIGSRNMVPEVLSPAATT